MTVTIGHRTFQFVSPKISLVKKFQKKGYEKLFTDEALSRLDEDDAAWDEMRDKWREFCSDVFVHDLRWRLFGFPDCLEFDNLENLGRVFEVARGFFALLQAILDVGRNPAESSPSSATGSKSESMASPETTKSIS